MKRLVVLIVLSTVLASGTGMAGAWSFGFVPAQAVAQESCQSTTLEALSDSGVQGMAQLCVDEAEVRASIEALELTPGEAYTVWFVYFDQAAACSATPCPPADVVSEDPLGVVTRMDGVIGGETGQEEFSGLFRDLRPSDGSEMHLVIFGHGPADLDDGRQLARQLLTPQRLAYGTPAMSVESDGDIGYPVAVAMFSLPGSDV